MESSKIFGDDNGAEACQSSESGWTMYIGSPLDDEDDGADDDMKNNVVYVHEEDDGDGSDDSMASDASSGPISHQQQLQPWENNIGEAGHGHVVMAHEYHDEDEKKYCCSNKKVKKQEKKQKKKSTGVDQARKESKEECLFTEKRGIVTVQSGNRAWYLAQRK